MIKLTNVTKAYGKGSGFSTPVKNFNLTAEKGETVILQGASGSGKSTVLHITAGLIKPTEGFAEINGRNISEMPEHFAANLRRSEIGMIFQNFHLIEDLTVMQNISLPMLPEKISPEAINEKVFMLAEKLGITSCLQQKAAELSGGEMQRTAIARALINSPSVILADEPTANLDAELTAELIEIFRILKSEGKTLLIATHDFAVTDSGIADKIIVMKKGE